MIYSFSEFLNEGYGNFEGSIQFTDWSDFKEKLKKAISTGFKTEEELVNLMGMNYDRYTKIRENMIMNWKDSVSKSLLHSIAQIGQKIPQKGTNIFKDLKQQTQFLIIADGGLQTRNAFGDTNGVDGLGILSKLVDLQRIKNRDPKNTKFDWDLKKDVMKNYVDFNGVPAYTIFNKVSDISPDRASNALRKVNEIVQYVWLYSFYHHYKLKKDNPKLPKYLYRGIRSGWLEGNIIEDLKKKASGTGKKHDQFTKEYIDSLIDYIVKNGISKISTGKLLSFTESRDIAAYFTNKEGIILRVDPKKVEIVTSPKTEEFFQEADYVSGKKEKEYVIKVPANYKFTKDDIEIVHGDYWLGDNSPLAVQFFDHDNKKATYKINGVGIKAQYVWKNNTSGGIRFWNTDVGNSWDDYSRRDFKKKFGFDPMPTEENMNQITEFEISEVKHW